VYTNSMAHDPFPRPEVLPRSRPTTSAADQARRGLGFGLISAGVIITAISLFGFAFSSLITLIFAALGSGPVVLMWGILWGAALGMLLVLLGALFRARTPSGSGDPSSPAPPATDQAASVMRTVVGALFAAIALVVLAFIVFFFL